MDYMKYAFLEAKKAIKIDEVPVGAIIVHNNKIIAKAHNCRQKKHNVLCHAEILAIIKASKKLKDWRLDDCEMYVTLSPCSMCKKIIESSRIQKVHFGVEKPSNKKEYYKTTYTQTNVCSDYKKMLKNFFKNKR